MSNNKENLIPMNQRTKEEQRKIAQQGGIASGIARREKKKFREIFQIILDTEITAKESKIIESFGFAPEDVQMTKRGLIAIACLQKAISKGDVNAAAKIAEIVGEFEPKGGNIILPETQNRRQVVINMPDSFKPNLKVPEKPDEHQPKVD